MSPPAPEQSQGRPPANRGGGLNSILNSDDEYPPPSIAPLQHGPPHQLRDSGFYSTEDTSSKHTSAASFNANGVSPSTSGYQSSSADKTPSPPVTNTTPQPTLSPSSSNMTVASIVSPMSSGTQRRFERPTSYEHAGPNAQTLGENLSQSAASRRESVDSRINQNFSDMRLGGSPYTSNNQSTSSIQNQLHMQRNPRPPMDAASIHRISNGYQPSADRTPEGKLIRTAPAITGPATGTIARAAEPTKGQAWAFPEEEIQSFRESRAQYDESRRSSVAESVSSSQFTIDSRLPPGQRRLEDGNDYPRMSNGASEFPPVHHHHTLQHRQLLDIQADAMNGANGAQPYSRTPELRVSHKLAERKRRTEMKELFDQLRDLMPQERGTKASKWEILTKAIAEHHKLNEHVRLLQDHYTAIVTENDMLRRELQSYQPDSAQPGGPPPQQQQQQHQHQHHPQPPPPPPPAQSNQYPNDHYAHPSRTELPPLRSINGGIHSGPDSMTGVQYDGPKSNNYH